MIDNARKCKEKIENATKCNEVQRIVRKIQQNSHILACPYVRDFVPLYVYLL